MEAQLFNNDRIKEAAQVIANELLKILAKRHDSHMQKHVAKNCPAYKKGLSNGEHLLATMRALSMVQLEVGVELADMTHTVDEDLHDDDDAPVEMVKYAAEPTWTRITKERYDYKLELTFPTSARERVGKGGYDERAFLVGEPFDHDAEGRPRYDAFLSREYNGVTDYFESDAPMSVVEFQSMSFFQAPHPQPDATP